MQIIYPRDFECGHAPTLAGFDATLGIIHSTILNEDAFIGAIQCGSWATGRGNLLSDIDVVGLYDEAEEVVQPTIQHIVTVAAAHHVPISDLQLIPYYVAMNGLHTITASFHAHLERDGRIIKAPILPHFSPHPLTLEQSALEYVSGKLRKIGHLRFYAHLAGTTEWKELIEAVLDTPFYASLRLLEVAAHSVNVIVPPTKQNIWRGLHRYAPPHTNLGHMEVLLGHLLDQRQQLIQDAEDAANGKPENYSRRLQQIADLGPTTFIALKKLGLHLEAIVELGATG